MKKQTGDSLNAMALRANVSYATAHAWSKGTAAPNVEKFNAFLKANNFNIRIINQV